VNEAFNFDPDRHLFTMKDEVIPSVTQVLARVGVCDFSYVDEETREMSMKRGQNIHWMLELEDEGALNYRTVPKKFRGYRKAWQAFKRATNCYILETEWKFVVPAYKYAGIIDRVVTFPSPSLRAHQSGAVLDIKTGEVCDWTKYQLVGYAVARAMAAGMSPAQAQFMQRFAVRLRSDGTYKVREFPRKEFLSDWAVFVEFLERVHNDNGSKSRTGT